MTKLSETSRNSKKRKRISSKPLVTWKQIQLFGTDAEIVVYENNDSRDISNATFFRIAQYQLDKPHIMRQSRSALKKAFDYKRHRVQSVIVMREFARLFRSYDANTIRQAIEA